MDVIQSRRAFKLIYVLDGFDELEVTSGPILSLIERIREILWTSNKRKDLVYYFSNKILHQMIMKPDIFDHKRLFSIMHDVMKIRTVELLCSHLKPTKLFTK